MTQVPLQGYLYSDDRLIDATFDAEPWFEQTTDKELVTLAKAGFGQCEEANAAALYAEGQGDRYVQVALGYVRDNEVRGIGFQVEIDPVAATAWIREHRPHLLDKLEETE